MNSSNPPLCTSRHIELPLETNRARSTKSGTCLGSMEDWEVIAAPMKATRSAEDKPPAFLRSRICDQLREHNKIDQKCKYYAANQITQFSKLLFCLRIHVRFQSVEHLRYGKDPVALRDTFPLALHSNPRISARFHCHPQRSTSSPLSSLYGSRQSAQMGTRGYLPSQE